MSDQVPDSAAEPLHHKELRDRWDAMLLALRDDRSAILRVYDDTIRNASSPVVTTIKHVFGPAVHWAQQGRRIREGEPALGVLARAYIDLRDSDRSLLIENAIAELLAMGNAADAKLCPERRVLESIGACAMRFVLKGTAEQMLLADLAAHLGLLKAWPASVREVFVLPLVDALTAALSLGAPAVRYNVIEALGALLKHVPEKMNVVGTPLLNEHERTTEGDERVNAIYEFRRQRDARIVKAIAGESEPRAQYFAFVQAAFEGAYDDLADYVRALPGLCRQEPVSTRPTMLRLAVEILGRGADTVNHGIDIPTEDQAAFARYHETVFRTIDVMLDRGAPAQAFDTAVAKAVDAVRQTLVGSLEVCNAYARATVAVLSAAAKIAAFLPHSRCDAALQPLYANLKTSQTEWTNPGLIEGCFRGLPLLMADNEHESWSRAALQTLLSQLGKPVDFSDLAGVHARLCATAAFRDLLIAAVERLHSALLELHTDEEEGVLNREVEHAIRTLLANPSVDQFVQIFRKQAPFPRSSNAPLMPRTFSADVLAGVAFASEVLQRTAYLFRDWRNANAARQLLLVRILGIQLASASRGRRDLARCEVLTRVFAGLSPIRLDERDRIEQLWRLLSAIPSPAAEAADADLQEFVEYRTGHTQSSPQEELANDDSDLPGYVLALVSDYVSYRLAADIARQVDLNRRRARHDDPSFDFAEPLYQVILRGPNPAIFDHLLARVSEPRDRQLLILLKRHVSTVQQCITELRVPGKEQPVIDTLKRHAEALINEINAYLGQRGHRSATLSDLVLAMRRFVVLATPSPELWEVIIGKPRRQDLRKLFEADSEDGGLEALFRVLDRLANSTPIRKPLTKLCVDNCAQLRLHVAHYLSLAVGEFDQCANAMRSAVTAVKNIEEDVATAAGLQPPEQIILLALLQSWRQMFIYTIDWWVETPRRCVQARRPKWFWRCIAHAPDAEEAPSGAWTRAAIYLERGKFDDSLNVRLYGTDEPELPLPPDWTRPPIPPGQDIAFERFFVEWMASELDIDHLHWALHQRWRWFRVGYGLITRKLSVMILISLPFLMAALLHSTRWHELEGIGFIAYVTIITVLAAVGLLGQRITDVRTQRSLRRGTSGQGHQPLFEYRYQALLPRLFRLIVAPLALVVDFEHSYVFPMHASDSVLMILMVLAFLTTSFFIRREVRARQNDRSRTLEVEIQPSEHRRVGQIVSIALAHSFAVALLFSFMFESHIVHRTVIADRALSRIAQQEREHPIRGSAAAFHYESYFLGFLPREAACDLSGAARWIGLPSAHAARFRFYFYPTLILSWTALGLFFGVFLEGFLKGERLRGET